MDPSSFWKKRVDPEQRYGLRLTLFALALLLVVIPFGLLLREVTQEGPLTRVDTEAATNLHQVALDSPALVTVMQVISLFGGAPWFYVVTGLAALWLWRRGHIRLALFLVVTGLIGDEIDSIVKNLVDRPRPSFLAPVASAQGKSFPSGHSMSAVVGYGSLLLVYMPLIDKRKRRLVVAGVMLLVLAIGFSRLALGVHYITDVVGGFVLGLAWLSASTAVFRIWLVERGTPTAL